MPQKGSVGHEKRLHEFKYELEREGWRVVVLKGKSPDAIAVKGQTIVAVEVLQKTRMPKLRKGHWRREWRYTSGYTLAEKKRNYDMFDDVFFVVWKH